MPGVGVLWEGAMCPLGNPICCLCFLSTLGTLFPLFLPILYALRFYFALGFSILLFCVQFAVLFCFGLTYKKKKKYHSLKWNHTEPKNNVCHHARAQSAFGLPSPHSVLKALLTPGSVTREICPPSEMPTAFSSVFSDHWHVKFWHMFPTREPQSSWCLCQPHSSLKSK